MADGFSEGRDSEADYSSVSLTGSGRRAHNAPVIARHIHVRARVPPNQSSQPGRNPLFKPRPSQAGPNRADEPIRAYRGSGGAKMSCSHADTMETPLARSDAIVSQLLLFCHIAYGHGYFGAGLCHEDSWISLMQSSLDKELSSAKHLCHSKTDCYYSLWDKDPAIPSSFLRLFISSCLPVKGLQPAFMEISNISRQVSNADLDLK
ncbi:unnamed protein product [Pleuronectes platessa]|uniref:Uncharacterized protein n=1 Tax=Pleuronectes platessa TaxID=8262 RepID=A0A9N7V1R0_PLEPL|nr:unnamed protein product [Pleuronectes platessa]